MTNEQITPRPAALTWWCQSRQGRWSKAYWHGNIYHKQFPIRCCCQCSGGLRSWPTWRSTRFRTSYNVEIEKSESYLHAMAQLQLENSKFSPDHRALFGGILFSRGKMKNTVPVFDAMMELSSVPLEAESQRFHYLRGGVLLAIITSFALPILKVSSVFL